MIPVSEILIILVFALRLAHSRPLFIPTSRPHLSDSWHHPLDHRWRDLFKRDNSTTYPPVGSPAWTSNYPYPPLPPNIPQAWVTALSNATSAGLIPQNIPISKLSSSGNPVYPTAENGGSSLIFSFTYGCTVSSDIVHAPSGMMGISFDDGPLPTSPHLYQFLRQQGQRATHFFIGSNILYYPKEFLQAYSDNGDDIAVHTYTHPYMTTLSNLQVVAELGWTMQIIHDSTGGRLPRFWRPPYGDVDNRVRAIASQVFGLTTVLWNYDSNDWHLQPTNPTYTPSSVHNSLVEWISGPKSPGLIILEHELSNDSVQAFIDVYPLAKSSGWDTRTIPDLLGDSWYLNAENSTTEDITSMDVAMGGVNSLPSSIAPSIPSAGTASFSLLSPPTPGSKATSSSLMSRPFGSVLVIVVALVPLLTLLDVFHSVHV